jgi:hypothetical protein
LFAVGRIRGPAIKQGDAMGKRQRLAARDVGAFFATSLAPLPMPMDVLPPMPSSPREVMWHEPAPRESGPEFEWQMPTAPTDTGEDAASS